MTQVFTMAPAWRECSFLRESLTRGLRAAAPSAPAGVLLDFDGTLAPFFEDRYKVVAFPGVRELLARLLETQHLRVALVTGRPCEELLGLLRLEQAPEIWGCHGAERLLPTGELRRRTPPAAEAAAVAEAISWVEASGWAERLEHKPAGLVFHTRDLEEAASETLCARVRGRWRELALDGGLLVQDFFGGVELRPLGVHKGQAVATIREELGPGAFMLYVGDDLSDEDAFRALVAPGFGLLACSDGEPSRGTAAQAWLRTPEELLPLLDLAASPTACA
jgi:trehalose-phosphatase